MKKLLAMLLAGVLLCMGAACFAGCDDDEFLDIKVLVYNNFYPDQVIGEFTEEDEDIVLTVPYNGVDYSYSFTGKLLFPTGGEMEYVPDTPLPWVSFERITSASANEPGSYLYRVKIRHNYRFGVKGFEKNITIVIAEESP